MREGRREAPGDGAHGEPRRLRAGQPIGGQRRIALLRQQRNVLTGFYEPKEPEKEPRAREVPIGLAEMAKDRWNRVLEETVQTAYNTDWRRVRESAEDRLSTVAQKIRESGK